MVKVGIRDCGDVNRRNLFPLILAFVGVFGFLLFCGCKDEDKGTRDESDGALGINGIQYSANDLTRELAFREELVRLTRPKADLDKVRPRIARSLTNEIVSSTLFLSAAENRGILADEAVTNAVLRKFQKAFVRGNIKSLADLEKQLSLANLADVYTNNLTRELAREAYLSVVHGDDLRVPEEDVDKFLQRIEDYNAMASATNALAYAKATNLWMRIKAGEDFATLADKESEDQERQPGGELGECEKIDFELNPGYWEKVSVLKAGEVSEVLTTDVGIEIVKALTDLAPSENTGEPALKLARIYFRRAMTHPEWTREETRLELEAGYREEVIQDSFLEVSSNATIIVNGKKLEKTARPSNIKDAK